MLPIEVFGLRDFWWCSSCRYSCFYWTDSNLQGCNCQWIFCLNCWLCNKYRCNIITKAQIQILIPHFSTKIMIQNVKVRITDLIPCKWIVFLTIHAKYWISYIVNNSVWFHTKTTSKIQNLKSTEWHTILSFIFH